MKKIILSLIFLAFLSHFSIAMASFTVTYTGCVTEKNLKIDPKVALLTLLQQAELTACAYPFATALTQTNQKDAQSLLKTQLLNEIDVLKQRSESEPLSTYLKRLQVLIENQPVTGRLLNWELDETRVEIIPLQNKRVLSESGLHFPSRPKSVFFIGSHKDSVLFNADKDLEGYLKDNPFFDFFQSGYAMIVQANTEIETVKVGLWTHEKYYVSPGSWVVGLLEEDIIEDVDPNFNQNLAKWLSTQVLP